MLIKKDKILIKNVWESKKYGVTQLIKEYPNKKWSKRGGMEDFLKQCDQGGPLNEHRVVDIVNHAIDEWRRRLSTCVDAEGGHSEHYI